MKSLFLVLGLAACGKVSLAPDASSDAPLADALACNADETVCDATCVATKTDNDNCGGCGLACSGSSSCMAGHCVDYTASCSTIHKFDATMPSAFYTLLDGSSWYCDMEDGGVGYQSLAYAAYNVAVPTGYTQVVLADLQAVGTQHAFARIYTKQSGSLPVLVAFTSSNCAVKVTTDTLDLGLNAGFVGPATVGAAGVESCNPMGGYSGSLGIYLSIGGIVGTTMADDFFTTHAVTTLNSGGDSTNPAWFWRKTPAN